MVNISSMCLSQCEGYLAIDANSISKVDMEEHNWYGVCGKDDCLEDGISDSIR